MLRYSIFTKFLVIVLCAVSLVVCAAGAAGILIAESNGLYTNDVDTWIEDQQHSVGYGIVYDYCFLYAAEHVGNCPENVLYALRQTYCQSMNKTGWAIALYQNGKLLEQSESIPADALVLNYTISPNCPSLYQDSDSDRILYAESVFVHDPSTGDYMDVPLFYYDGPEYQVVLYLQPDILDDFQFAFITILYQMRYHFITMLVAGLLFFAVTLVCLCCAAGRHPKSPAVYPVALNRLPLDLYAAIIVAAEAGVSWLVMEMLEACFDYGGNWAVASLICLGGFAMALMVVAYLFAFAAQMKTRGGFWWRRTITGFLLRKFLLGLKYIGRGFRFLFRGIAAVCNMLPLVWQWVGVVILMMAVPGAFFLCVMIAWDGFWELFWGFLFFASLAADVVLVGWWIWYMGQIIRGVAAMRQGNLDHKIPTAHMRGKFREFAVSLNSMADAARIAAERQLKSERMKTELITNVSHDIKTPLTSIINYVDLLKKPHDEMQGQQYLDVLDRQSQRLKKLIVDLMDMSKASTGNMGVELCPMDAVEAVNQALGEFSDKLTAAGLEPLFRAPRESVMIRADGRLLWRVLSNLLSNAVKYAMPGTRLYLDLMTVQGNAVLNLKNISRDQLNVDAEELMERFVRGDASRNTEGSGLGLNIAKSLVELQKGQMHLMVDGDLFKVTVVLPLCED